jgi:hypothetical protein
MTPYPQFGLDERIPDFLQRFFRAADDPNATDELLLLFTSDASFKSGKLEFHGSEGPPPPPPLLKSQG